MFHIMYIFLVIFPILVVPINGYVTVVKMGLLAYIAFSIWAVFLFKWYKQKQLPTRKKLFLPELFLLLFAMWIVLSTIFSEHPYISLFGTYRRHEGLLALYSYFTVFFIAFRFTQIEKYKYWLTGLVSMSMIAGIYGVLQKFPLNFLPFLERTQRVDSFFGNPNFYGSYLTIMLFLAIILTLTANNKKNTILFSLAANLLFINVLYAKTRSAFVGIFLGLILFSLFLWFNFPNLRKRYAGLLFTFIILFTIVNVTENNSYLQRVSSIAESAGQVLENTDESGRAGSGRWKLWEIALPLVAEYPVFGSGPDTLTYVYDHEAYLEYANLTDHHVDKAHNEYLQIAITMGIPALLFYLAFLSTVFWAAWRSLWESSGEKQLLLAGFLALLIAYLIQGFFNISVVTVAPFFWLILGMAYSLAQESPMSGSYNLLKAIDNF